MPGAGVRGVLSHAVTYLAFCARLPGNELIAAECEHLTGAKPDADGVAVCQTIASIERAAYVHTGIRLIATGAHLADLLESIAAQSFASDDFRIEFLHLTSANSIGQRQAILAIADRLPSYPNLDAPQHRFLLAAHASGLWFGEILAETNMGYQAHDKKPYRTSSSMPSRLARAMVNLAAPPAQSLIDPCCGTGSILLEAAALGLLAFGMDKNPKMVGMTRRNLAHFGLDAQVTRGDSRQWRHRADAVVTDLPYGRFSSAAPEETYAILQQALKLAPLGLYVSDTDLTSPLRRAGYQKVEVFRIIRRPTMIRYIHRAQA